MWKANKRGPHAPEVLFEVEYTAKDVAGVEVERQPQEKAS